MPPFCFHQFTVAKWKIETRPENKKCSICPKITFSFSDLDYLTPPLTRGLNRGRMGSSCFRWMKTVFMNIPNHFFAIIHRWNYFFHFRCSAGSSCSRGLKVKFLKMLQPEKELVDAISYVQFINGRPPRFILPIIIFPNFYLSSTAYVYAHPSKYVLNR